MLFRFAAFIGFFNLVLEEFEFREGVVMEKVLVCYF